MEEKKPEKKKTSTTRPIYPAYANIVPYAQVAS
jgi:hypothetical protein